MGPDRIDVAIAGAGIVGLSLALAIRQGVGPSARLAVFDPAVDRPGEASLRAVAIAAGSRRFLHRLGVWDAIEGRAHPMTEMVLTDSRPTMVPPPVFLDFGGEVAPGEPFAHMVPHDHLWKALVLACREAGIALRDQAIGEVFTSPGGVTLGRTPEAPIARLLVAADGSRSGLRERAGIGRVGRGYDQAAVTATLAHEHPHGGRATQHFLPGGPLAILPMRADDGSGRRFSLVWTERQAEARRLAGLDEGAFLAELTERIGHAYGTLRLEDRPRAHDLAVSLARDLIAPRLALVGDVAHTIHPLAGQGLNLGLADAASLGALVSEALRLGLDPGAPSLLADYQRSRRADSVVMAATTHIINRLFSNDLGPLRLIRDLGLGLVDRSPGLKRALMRQAAGIPPETAEPATRRRLTAASRRPARP